MNVSRRRMYSFFAFAAAALFMFSWVLAAVADGSWTYGVNTLSDLGVSSNAVSVVLFNWSACVLCALLWTVEVLGVMRTESGYGRIYGATAACSMVMLVLIGVINKGYGLPHLIVTFIYMLFAVSSMIACCKADFFRRRRIYVDFTIGMMAADVVLALVWNFPGFEATAIAMSVFWSALVAEAYGSYEGPSE